jgi:hypothetical protein
MYMAKEMKTMHMAKENKQKSTLSDKKSKKTIKRKRGARYAKISRKRGGYNFPLRYFKADDAIRKFTANSHETTAVSNKPNTFWNEFHTNTHGSKIL